jgi:hypothetical protein
MNPKSYPTLSLDPEAWELSVVAHRPRRTWFPRSSRAASSVNPRIWQTRAARGFSWHRAGQATKRDIER